MALDTVSVPTVKLVGRPPTVITVPADAVPVIVQVPLRDDAPPLVPVIPEMGRPTPSAKDPTEAPNGAVA